MKDKYENDNKSKLLDVLLNDIRVYIMMTCNGNSVRG